MNAADLVSVARFRAVNRNNVESLRQWQELHPDLKLDIRVVSSVLPFRTNRYVVDELIDWESVPDDPMYRLTFPHRDMIDSADFARMERLIVQGADRETIGRSADEIRARLNPHPSGQKTLNVPLLGGAELPGIQHKYRETVLFFPARGQTCHAYCTYCFRWAQFVGDKDLRFAAPDVLQLVAYLERHPDVTDVLITGGDPLIMKTATLRNYLEPLLHLDQLSTIRIGSKAPAYWPQRFTSDNDADDLLGLFEEVAVAGKQLALMAHFTHPRELTTEVAQLAVERVRASGANVRMQSPLARHVNDSGDDWADMWRIGARLGCVPYYMFVERDTGAHRYFEIPLIECWGIFQQAYSQVSGLARTVRGPCMSATPGKVHILGRAKSGTDDVFVCEYLQARDPNLVRRPFFATFDDRATWFDQLTPARPADTPFFPRMG